MSLLCEWCVPPHITAQAPPVPSRWRGFFLVYQMPVSAPKPCNHPGCGVLVRDGSSRCPKHPKQAWVKTQAQEQGTKRIRGRRLQKMREQLLAQQPLCAACDRLGVVRLATERDHIIPLTKGGTDDPSNIQALCHDCHESKSLGEALRGRSPLSYLSPRGRGGATNFPPPTGNRPVPQIFVRAGFGRGGISH